MFCLNIPNRIRFLFQYGVSFQLYVYLHEIMKEKSVAFEETYDWETLPQYQNGRMMAVQV